MLHHTTPFSDGKGKLHKKRTNDLKPVGSLNTLHHFDVFRRKDSKSIKSTPRQPSSTQFKTLLKPKPVYRSRKHEVQMVSHPRNLESLNYVSKFKVYSYEVPRGGGGGLDRLGYLVRS